MTLDIAAGLPRPCPARGPSSATSAGEVHLDWPADKIAEALKVEGGTLWVDIQAKPGDVAGVEALFRDVFEFHPLAIDDALKETHVPKLDDWGRYLYTVFHALDYDPACDEGLKLSELDLFLGANYLVSYHTLPIPAIDRLRKSIERDGGNRLKHGPDHVLYLLLDLGVDDYMTAIEKLDDAIDDAQDEVFADPTRDTLRKIFRHQAGGPATAPHPRPPARGGQSPRPRPLRPDRRRGPRLLPRHL